MYFLFFISRLSIIKLNELKLLNRDHTYDPKSHLISGGLAGGLAAAVTNPLDCVKTV